MHLLGSQYVQIWKTLTNLFKGEDIFEGFANNFDEVSVRLYQYAYMCGSVHISIYVVIDIHVCLDAN
jgi:hypothetical protein